MAPMNVPRYDHSCGLFALKNGYTVVVVVAVVIVDDSIAQIGYVLHS
jgi:hypothetical protein